MSEKYIKICIGICPDCDGKMESYGEHYHIGYECKRCGVQWKFNDDMGPGSYSAKYTKGGRIWTSDRLEDVLNDLEEINSELDDNPELWKAYNLIKDELNKVKKELKPK